MEGWTDDGTMWQRSRRYDQVRPSWPCEESSHSQKQNKKTPSSGNITIRHGSRQCCSPNGSTNVSSPMPRSIWRRKVWH